MEPQWNTFGKNLGPQARVFYIQINDFGHVYAYGSTHSVQTDWDLVLNRFNPYGDTVWTRRFNSGGNESGLRL